MIASRKKLSNKSNNAPSLVVTPDDVAKSGCTGNLIAIFLDVDSFINLGKTTAGNRLLLRFAEEGARAQIRVAKHMREWKANQKLANGNRRPISFNEWEIENYNSNYISAKYMCCPNDKWSVITFNIP